MMDGSIGFDPYAVSPPVEHAPAIWATSENWDAAALPPRDWLATGYFLRGSVTTIVGAGGVSKSSLVIAWACALALGKPLHRMQPRGPFKCAVFNVEDDASEQERRLTATLTSMGQLPADLAGRVLRIGPTKAGTLFDRDRDTGIVVPTAAMVELGRSLEAFGADVLFVDPLAELHGIDENDNTGMRGVIAEFRTMAVRLGIAVVIIHHTRKGANTPGDAEAGRGASAISGASRVVLTVSGMTGDDAKAFGLPPGQERHYLRLDGGKANYSSLTEVEWFERSIFLLPNDDSVAVTVPWNPPKDFITPEAQTAVEAAIRRGHADGPLSYQFDEKPRSVKRAMVAAGVTTRQGQRDLLEALVADGFTRAKFRSTITRKPTAGLRSPDGLPAAHWLDDDEAGDEGTNDHDPVPKGGAPTPLRDGYGAGTTSSADVTAVTFDAVLTTPPA